VGLTDEHRRQYKTAVLHLTRDRVLAAAAKYFYRNLSEHAVVIISDEEKLREANKELPDTPLTLNRI
jgi:Zn-dependent M16 (insulinase) family peptidase